MEKSIYGFKKKRRKKAYYGYVAENRNGGTAFSEALHIGFLLDLKRLIGCMEGGGRESTYSRT